MSRRGHNVDVVTSNSDGGPMIHSGDFNVHRLPVNLRVYNTPVSLQAYLTIKKLAKKVDLIHTYAYPVFFSDASCYVASRMKIPLVLDWVIDPRQSPTYRQSILARAITDLYFEVSGRRVFKKASAIVVPSVSYKKYLANHHIPQEKAKVVPCGIDTDFFTPSLVLKDFTKARGFDILYVGRINDQKGFDILLQAFPFVLRKHPETTLTVIGLCDQPHFWRRIQRYLKQVEAHVRFLGNLTSDQLRDHYRKADLLVFPSRYESFGMVPLEAMSCGTPVVGTPVGVVTDSIREAGILVRSEDSRSLAEALNKLLSNSELRAELSKKASEIVSRKYNWDEAITKYEAIYRSCICQN
jgi:glycosyltransferase involved in cell wall biosynthesis